MDDLIVVDDEYESLNTTLDAYGTVFEEQINEYLRIMAAICDNIITEGSVAQNLKAFSLKATRFIGKTEELTTSIQASCDCFIEDIDTADEYLY